MPSSSVIPFAAKWLGNLGVIPFIFLACTAILSKSPVNNLQSLIAYGAVILSFLGGIHWGLAFSQFEKTGIGHGFSRRFFWGVAPSLIAWVALLMPVRVGLLLLALAFVLVLALDRRACRNAEAPAWYFKFRLPLTLAVVSSLTLSMFA